ncbi:hypothetical protein CVS47_02370 [Microbacterium lemovicicum]|uniref:Phosphodiesterase n=1 Tax=Microbacterium lemovicicum TaxID=1072463 RepID=A0A3S9WCF2_9MICO|nr:hypothetical protein [Microbacterium lemovicicum]AZS37724.1 hypothetical protein CVS47_02370 [Microbacterium lemovicicum]
MPVLVARILGRVLRGAIGLILRVRRPRPIHPHGLLLRGEVEWMPGAPRSGIAWVDQAAGTRAATRARVSRSVGLPSLLPDVIGLALRVDTGGGGFGDVELATTGRGVPGRFLLLPRLTVSRATFATLLPYRTDGGPVHVSARRSGRRLPADLAALRHALASEPLRLELSFARGSGPWHPFAVVTLRVDPDQDDRTLRFDAVRHAIPGARAYEAVRLLRQPSYRLAQDGSGRTTKAPRGTRRAFLARIREWASRRSR